VNRDAPIGVFDSGFGGLSAARELRRLLPGEDLVYFGDNARIPYGDRSPDTITEYSLQDAAFLLSKGVKAILVACGTVSSVALDTLRERSPVPVEGVIEPAVREALRISKNGVVGVIGTNATVRSGAYSRAVSRISGGEVKAVSVPCPLLVPLVENGYVDDGCLITRLAVREYLEPLKAAGADCIILGCTHYPLIRGIIASEWGRDELVNTGLEGARALEATLRREGALRSGGAGKLSLYSSDRSDFFGRQASLFLGEECPGFERVDITRVRGL